MLTLFSFLGGTAFRLIFGQVMEWMNKRQDHLHEMEMQRLQSELESQRHERDMARLRLQNELAITEIKVASDAAVAKGELDAFIEAVKGTRERSGISWVDAWNQCIRPFGASIALAAWVAEMALAGFVFSDFDTTLISAFIGVFVGERIHARMKG